MTARNDMPGEAFSEYATASTSTADADTFAGRLARFVMAWCELLVVAMMLVIALDVFSRTVFDYSWQMSEEIAGYLLVALVFSSLPLGVREGTLLRVDFLFARGSERTQRRLDLLFSALGLVFAAIWTWQLVRLVWSSYTRETASNGVLAVPLWVPQFVMPVGVALLTLALLVAALRLWRARGSTATGKVNAS